MTALLSARRLRIEGRLQPTDLDLVSGEMVALIGPNGGGKTSLLRAIAGVEEAKGSAEIDGVVLAGAGPGRGGMIGLMSASRDIGWPIPVRDVVTMGVARPDAAAIARLLVAFELDRLTERPVSSLSTGERSRVLMARALAANPRLLLLDEPLSNLDPYWVLRFIAAMRGHAAGGAAVLCALHDLAQLNRFDRALLIADGRLVVDMTPALLVRSALFEESFRIAADGRGGWRVKPSAGPRSSP
ncbi:MAG: ABC transporter ATP-binding protein [Sphingomicrobium sp.]